MAANAGSILDESGAASDWIELVNAGEEPLDLRGFSVSDDWRVPDKGPLPDGLLLGPGEHLLLWADGTDAAGHLPFQLDADGESVGVFDADGRALDWVVLYPPLGLDEAYARLPDGAETWILTPRGTPGAANRAFVVEPVEALAVGGPWAYWDQGIEPVGDWRRPDFDDAGWPVGAAPLGYGDPVTTEVAFGDDPDDKHITTWFCSSFTLQAAALDDAVGARLSLRVDDGAVVWIGGSEVLRVNLPAGSIAADTLADSATSEPGETTYSDAPLDLAALRPGRNVVAVELHQASPSSSDLGFDLGVAIERLTELD